MVKGSLHRDVRGAKGGLKKILADRLCFQKDLFIKFKGTPSREEHKTSFSVLTNIELKFLVPLK
jgi:hypothetical protein